MTTVLERGRAPQDSSSSGEVDGIPAIRQSERFESGPAGALSVPQDCQQTG